MRTDLSAPWLRFLRAADAHLEQPVEVHCLGGFVLAALWQLPRPTGDIDVVEVIPSQAGEHLLRVAGEGSEIARTHRLCFQRVSIAEYPEAYASRLIGLDVRGVKRLKLRAFELHDLVLAKLGRNSARDRSDIAFLVERGLVNRSVLEERYETELRPYVLNEKRHDTAFRLWLDEFFGGR